MCIKTLSNEHFGQVTRVILASRTYSSLKVSWCLVTGASVESQPPKQEEEEGGVNI